MTTLTIVNYKTEVERALLRVLRLAFLARRPAVASTAALQAVDVAAYLDGDLCYVTAEGCCYEYSRYSGAASSPPAVLLPITVPADFPGARWLRVQSPATFGPNWRALLQARQTGTCAAVELYTGDGGMQEIWQRVQAATPSLMLEWRQDAPRPLSCGYQGAKYRIDITYAVSVFSENLRGAPASSHGSPPALGETGDPGPAALIGQLRRVCAGLSGTDLDLVGVDRIEIGPSRLVEEELAERFLVWEAELKAICYVPIPDEDLDTLKIDVQPELSDSPPIGPFDPLNYVARGYTLSSAAGLTASWAAGVALIDGAGVSSAPVDTALGAAADVYRDLKPDGTFAITAVPWDAPAPALTSGALRVGVTRTDQTSVLRDQILCSYSQVYRDRYQVVP